MKFKLPDRSPERTWAGRGCGTVCALCGDPVEADELEYELEYVTGDQDKPSTAYHVHISCFWTWESERQKRESKRGGKTPVALSGVVAEVRASEDDGQTTGSEDST
jgi:hypothetical protein